MLFSAIVITVTSYLIYRRIKNRRYNHLISKIPCPPRSKIPFLGHLYLMTEEMSKLPPGAKLGEAYFKHQMRVAEEFKHEGIVATDFEILGGTFVYILKANMYRDLITDTKNISKSKFYFLASDFLGNSNLLLSDGNTWKVARKLITPAFHYSILEQFAPSFNACANDLCNDVYVKKCTNNLYGLASHYLMKSFMETSLGINVTKENENIVDEYLLNYESWNDGYSERITKAAYAYDWIWRLSSNYPKWKESIEYLHNFTSEAITKRMEYLTHQNEENLNSNNINNETVPQKKKSCLADTLIREHINNPELYTFEYIRYQLDTFTFAGHDTTSITLTNTLYLIALYQDVQKKLKKEINDSLTTDELESISIESLGKLKYLDAVLKESQRLYPAVSTVGREITHEMIIDKYKIPKGAFIAFNLYALNRDPDQFSNPNTFNPDRFLPDSEENKKRHPFAFVPFSGGLRNCIGQKFAVYELKIFLIKILSKFDIVTNVKEEDIRFCQGTTLHISNKIDMEFISRN